MRADLGSMPPKLADPLASAPAFGDPAFGESITSDYISRPEGGGSVKYNPTVLLSETALCSWSKCFL